jgi:hypothetical protein
VTACTLEQVAEQLPVAGVQANARYVEQGADGIGNTMRILQPHSHPPQPAAVVQEAPQVQQQPEEDQLQVMDAGSGARVSGAAAARLAVQPTPNSKNYSKRRSGVSAGIKPRKQSGAGVRRKRLSREFEEAGGGDQEHDPHAAASVQGANPHQPTGREVIGAAWDQLQSGHPDAGSAHPQIRHSDAEDVNDGGRTDNVPGPSIVEAGSQAGSAAVASSRQVAVEAEAGAAVVVPSIVPPADYEPLPVVGQRHDQQSSQQVPSKPAHTSVTAAGRVMLPPADDEPHISTRVAQVIHDHGGAQGDTQRDAAGAAGVQQPSVEPPPSSQAPQQQQHVRRRVRGIQDLLSRAPVRQRSDENANPRGSPDQGPRQGDRNRDRSGEGTSGQRNQKQQGRGQGQGLASGEEPSEEEGDRDLPGHHQPKRRRVAAGDDYTRQCEDTVEHAQEDPAQAATAGGLYCCSAESGVSTLQHQQGWGVP